jgi:hypothetical protein
VADGVRNRAPGRLGGIPAVDVDAHAHFGDTAYACHWGSCYRWGREPVFHGSHRARQSWHYPVPDTILAGLFDHRQRLAVNDADFEGEYIETSTQPRLTR